MLRILVIGSRKWARPGVIFHRLEALKENLQVNGETILVIHGDDNKGADAHAAWACKGLGIPHLEVPFDWQIPGPPDQGHLKNCNLLDHHPVRVLVFHEDPQSSITTLDCIKEAEKRLIPVEFIYE